MPPTRAPPGCPKGACSRALSINDQHGPHSRPRPRILLPCRNGTMWQTWAETAAGRQISGRRAILSVNWHCLQKSVSCRQLEMLAGPPALNVAVQALADRGAEGAQNGLQTRQVAPICLLKACCAGRECRQACPASEPLERASASCRHSYRSVRLRHSFAGSAAIGRASQRRHPSPRPSSLDLRAHLRGIGVWQAGAPTTPRHAIVVPLRCVLRSLPLNFALSSLPDRLPTHFYIY